MKIDSAEFRVRQGEIVDLARRPTTSAPLCKSDRHYAARLQKHVEHLSAFQQLLYATDRQRHLHANGTRIIKFFLHLSE